MADIIWHVSTGEEVTQTQEPLEIASCQYLEKQIQKSKMRNNGRNPFGLDTRLKMDAASESAPMLKSMNTASIGGASSDDFSTTNIQEAGVDEADIIKNDGSHIFVARNGEIRIVKAYPQNEMIEDAVISIDTMQVTELFLSDNTLIATGYKKSLPYSNNIMMKKMSSSYYNNNQFTEVRVFDITDRTNPVETRKVSLEGSMVSSRKIGGHRQEQ